MSLPRIFDHPLSLSDPFDDNGFFSRFALPPKTQDDNGHLAFIPPCDITENKKNFSVKLDLPGFEKDDIAVSLEDGVLQIEAESSSVEEEKEGDKVIRSERRHGKYMRRFTLGDNVDDQDVQAHFENGVLSLDIPKRKTKKVKTTKIAID